MAYHFQRFFNRLTATAGALAPTAGTLYYSYNAGNRLINTKTGSLAGPIKESYTYDDNGSLKTITVPGDTTSARNLVFTWDVNNRLVKADAAVFGYDPSGYRIKKVVNPTSKNYYLEGEHLEAVYDDQSVLQAQYFRGSVIDEIVNGYQRNAGGELINSTFLHDALQSVLGQSGHDGSILAAQSYTAFGRVLNQSGATNNPMKYTGREQDGTTGFYYYRARYYDPVVGRFISEDPKGFGAGVNFYAYCLDNPVNCSDPSGLDAYTLGVSVQIPYIKTGVSVGGFVAGVPFIPSTTKENFDIGLYGQVTPGRVATAAEVTNYLGITNIPSLGVGYSSGALTINGGVQIAGRDGLNGLSFDYQLGAGARGATLSIVKWTPLSRQKIS